MIRVLWMALAAVLVLNAPAQMAGKGKVSPNGGASPGYPVRLRVVKSFVSLEDGQAYLHLVGSVNGVDVELVDRAQGGTYFGHPILQPGDYQARVAKEQVKPNGTVLRIYEVAFPDGSHEKFTMVSLSGRPD